MSPHDVEFSLSGTGAFSCGDDRNSGMRALACALWTFPRTGRGNRTVSQGADLEHAAADGVFRFATLFAINEYREAGSFCAGVGESGQRAGKLVAGLWTPGSAKVRCSRQRMVHMHFPSLHDGGAGAGGRVLRSQALKRFVAVFTPCGSQATDGVAPSRTACGLAAISGSRRLYAGDISDWPARLSGVSWTSN